MIGDKLMCTGAGKARCIKDTRELNAMKYKEAMKTRIGRDG